MKDKNIVELQMDLISDMWAMGYASFKSQAMGQSILSNPYFIGMKSGRVAILSLQKVRSGNSKVKVAEESDELRRIEETAKPGAMMSDMDIVTGFAIARGWSEDWQYLDTDRRRISYNDKMVTLREVLSR